MRLGRSMICLMSLQTERRFMTRPLHTRLRAGTRGPECIRPRVVAPPPTVHQTLRSRVPGPLFLICIVLMLGASAGLPRLWRLTTCQSEGARLLLCAAGENDIDTVRQLLDQGLGPDDCDTGVRALMLTSDPEVARLLIARGAKIEGDAIRGTPLIDAIMADRNGVVEILLDAGADPNRCTPGTDTSPLRMARLFRNRVAARPLRQRRPRPE